MAIFYKRTAKISGDTLYYNEVKTNGDSVSSTGKAFAKDQCYLNMYTEPVDGFNCYEVLNLKNKRLMFFVFNGGSLVKSILGYGEIENPTDSLPGLSNEYYKLNKEGYNPYEPPTSTDEFDFVCVFLRWNQYAGLKKIMPHLKMSFAFQSDSTTHKYRHNYFGLPFTITAGGETSDSWIRFGDYESDLFEPLTYNTSIINLILSPVFGSIAYSNPDGDGFYVGFEYNLTRVNGYAEATFETRFDNIKFI